jgi:hypothetical protein
MKYSGAKYLAEGRYTYIFKKTAAAKGKVVCTRDQLTNPKVPATSLHVVWGVASVAQSARPKSDNCITPI